MKPQVRKFFFWLCVLVFVVAGAYFILLSRGIVIDLAHLKLIKTGAIVLRFSPTGAEVLLNGKPYPEKSFFLGRDVLFEHLRPGHYHVSITKDGYAPWEGDLDVKSGMVTRNIHIVLFEGNSKETSVAKNVLDFWLTKRGPVIQKTDGTLLFNATALRGTSVVLWSPESAVLVTQSDGAQFVTELDNPQTALNVRDLFVSLKEQQLKLPGAVPIKKLFLHPFSEKKLFVETAKSLYLLDLAKISINRLSTASSTIQAVAVGNTETFIADAKGNVTAVNLILNTSSLLLLPTSSLPISLSVDPSANYIVFETADGTYSVYDRGSSETVRVPAELRSFYPSDDGKRLVFLTTQNKLGILYTADYDDGETIVKKGTVQFVPVAGEFRNFTWLPDSEMYGVVVSGNDLLAVELKDGSRTNSAVLARNVKKYALLGKDVFVEKLDESVVKLGLNY